MSTASLPPKEIPLSRPYRKLVFDRQDGEFRAALYHDVYHHKRTSVVRDTAKGTTLTQTLYALFPNTYEARIRQRIMTYITSTEWGRSLA